MTCFHPAGLAGPAVGTAPSQWFSGFSGAVVGGAVELTCDVGAVATGLDGEPPVITVNTTTRTAATVTATAAMIHRPVRRSGRPCGVGAFSLGCGHGTPYG